MDHSGTCVSTRRGNERADYDVRSDGVDRDCSTNLCPALHICPPQTQPEALCTKPFYRLAPLEPLREPFGAFEIKRLDLFYLNVGSHCNNCVVVVAETRQDLRVKECSLLPLHMISILTRHIEHDSSFRIHFQFAFSQHTLAQPMPEPMSVEMIT
ncbi:hypothetical protein BT69DRAFT_229030 [Atractiella rhizophila]|nr:hypothetical protein BT69DRAFT_229030 [Atractiella rhizophila]